MKNDLEDRLLKFSVNVIFAVRNFPNGKEFQIIAYQIIKSATSVGANYQEAQGAVSKADFANKIGIALKEIRETNYWITIILKILEKNENWLILKKEAV